MELHFEKLAGYLSLYLTGIEVTLQFTIGSWILGFLLGFIIALIKVSKFRILKLVTQFYTSIFRGTPQLVQLFIIYYATPQLIGYEITAFQAAVLAFGLNSAAYISEILRGGIQAIDYGQTEAALSLGISYPRLMCGVILPQTLKNVLPGLVNESISLMKSSSLVAVIGVMDIMRAAQTIQNRLFIAFEPLLVAAAIYYVMVMAMTALSNRLERRIKVSDKGN